VTAPTQAVVKRLNSGGVSSPTFVQASDGDKVIYTCPSTPVKSALVKSVRATLNGVASGTLSWGIVPSGSAAASGTPPFFAVARYLLDQMDISAGDPITDEVTAVMLPGDKLIVAVFGASGSTVTVTVSGAELS
jgi:ABC-type iron transport system FetAB ATPase subunit